MSVLIWLVGAWLTLNAALVAALWFRRPNPKLRAVRRLGIMLSAAKEAGQLSRGPASKEFYFPASNLARSQKVDGIGR